MRKAKNQAGDGLFTREEWLTAAQVKGFFSRLSKLFKGKLATLDQEVSTIEMNIPKDEDDEEEKVEREILITEIEDQIQEPPPCPVWRKSLISRVFFQRVLLQFSL